MKSKFCYLILISLVSVLMTNCSEHPEVVNAVNPDINIYPNEELLSVELGSSINFQIELVGKDATFNKLVIIQTDSSGSQIEELENRSVGDPLYAPYYFDYEFIPIQSQLDEVVELSFKFENATETNSGAFAISTGIKTVKIKIK